MGKARTLAGTVSAGGQLVDGGIAQYQEFTASGTMKLALRPVSSDRFVPVTKAP